MTAPIFIGNSSEVITDGNAELVVQAGTPANSNNAVIGVSNTVSAIYVMMGANTIIGANAVLVNPVASNIALLQIALTSMNTAIMNNTGGYSNTDQTTMMANVGLLYAQTVSLLVHTNILSGITPVGAVGTPGTPAGLADILGAGASMNNITNTVNGTTGCFNLLGMLSSLLSGSLLLIFLAGLQTLINQINSGTAALIIITQLQSYASRILAIINADINYYLGLTHQMGLFSLAAALIAAFENPCAAFMIGEVLGTNALLSAI